MATLYVSTSGSDSNPGTFASPFRTIQHAHDQTNPGDTVIVSGGEYNEKITISTDGTSANPITYEAAAAETVWIDGNFTLPSTNWVAGTYDPSNGYLGFVYTPLVKLDASHIVWDGLNIRDSSGRGLQIHSENARNPTYVLSNITVKNTEVQYSRYHNVRVWHVNGLSFINCKSFEGGSFAPFSRSGSGTQGWPQGMISRFSTNVLYDNCIVERNWGEGLDVGADNDNTTVRNCVIHNNYAVSLYFNHNKNSLVEKCIIAHDNLDHQRNGQPSAGITMQNETNPTYNGSPDCADLVIRNNLVVGTLIGLNTWSSGSFTNIKVYSNTFVNGYDYNMSFNSNPSYSSYIVKNNLFYHTETAKLAKNYKPSGVTLDYNAWSATPGANVFKANDVSGDVDLANPNVGLGGLAPVATNYSKGAASVAISQGENLAEVTDDYYGSPRANPPDMGFDEYGGTPSASITADFTGTPLSGVTPLSVTFTDASTATNTITSWTWEKKLTSAGSWTQFSTSSTPAAENFTTGTWDVRLTVSNADGTNAKVRSSYISVTDTPTSASGGRVWKAAATIPTAGATFDVVNGSVGDTPDAALFFMVRSTGWDTPSDDAIVCVGACTATDEWFAVASVDAGVTPSNALRGIDETDVVQIIDPVTQNFDAELSFNSFLTGGVRLNIDTAPPNGYRLLCVFFAGTDAVVTGNINPSLSGQNAAQNITALGDQANLVFMTGVAGGVSSVIKDHARLFFGAWVDDGTTPQQGAVTFYATDADASNVVESAISDQYAGLDPNLVADNENYQMEIGSYATGFTFTPRSSTISSFERCLYLAIKIPTGLKWWQMATNEAGQSLTGAGFFPETLLLLATERTAIGHGAGAGLAIGALDTDGAVGVAVCAQSGGTVAKSVSYNDRIQLLGADASEIANIGLNQFTSDGAELTISSTGGDMQFIAIGFEADTVTNAATVQFDLALALVAAPSGLANPSTGTEAARAVTAWQPSTTEPARAAVATLPTVTEPVRAVAAIVGS